MSNDRCYPYKLAKNSENIYLEIPEKEGHAGFTIPRNQWNYMESATD